MNAPNADARRHEAMRWRAVAAEDLRVARACLMLQPPSLGVAAYHCQQAAEKTMKALLIAAGVVFRKIHDLDELADVLVLHYPDNILILNECRGFYS